MTNQLQDVRRLEAEFADAMTRMYAVGNGLARMRASLELPQTTAPASGQSAPPASAGAAPSAPAVPQRPPASAASATAPASAPAGAPRPAVPVGQTGPAAGPRPAAPSGMPPIPPSAPPVPSWWQREGAVTRVLALAGAVITLIGIALLLALAMQQGWFVPELRVALGVALAIGLVVTGHVVRAREASRGVASAAPIALAATGYAAGYLDVVAVTTIYGWVPDVAGLAIGAIIAVSGLFVARRWDSQLLAVLTVVGATCLAPVVADGFGDEVSFFVVVLSAAALLARGDRGWPVLALARTLPAAAFIPLGIDASEGAGEPSKLAVIAIGLIVVMALIGAVSAGRFNPRDVVGSAALAVSSVSLLASIAVHDDPLRTTGMALVAAGFAVALAVTSKTPVGPVPTPLAVTIGAVSGIAALFAILSGVPERWIVSGILLLTLGYAAAAVTTRSRITLWIATGLAVVASIAYLIHPTAYMTLWSAREHDAASALLDSVLAGGVAALGAWGVDVVRGIPAHLRRATRVAALIAGLATSAVAVVSVGLLLGEALAETEVGFIAGHALATVLWMLVSAWLLLRGLKAEAHRDLAVRLGLGLAGVSVAKLFLFDLATLDGVWRVVAFIVTGLLLLASGTSYARALERTRQPVNTA